MARGLIEDRSELEALFDEFAQELATIGTSAQVVMVGGAWMLWHSRRMSTRDVDSGRPLDPGLESAVVKVAERHGLSNKWLNDSAAAFWPLNADYDACKVVYQTPNLEVRTPDPGVMFVMKLYRANPQDREDLVSLWPLCGFSDPEVAAAAFRSAYPHAPEDEYLADYIGDVAGDAAV
ncbi:MAG: DUF6036 family nucleotidyltransferase [Acidimicrobiia bacterium]